MTAQEQVAFSMGLFTEALNKVERLLAELWCVDKLEEEILRQGDELTGDVLAGPIEVTIGWTHPYQRRIYVAPHVGVDAARAAWATTIRDAQLLGQEWARSEMGYVRMRIRYLMDPLPTRLEWSSETMQPIGTMLDTGFPEDLAELEKSMSDWHGLAADKFYTDFYLKIKDAAEAHAWATGQIAAGIAGGTAVLDLGRQSLQNVALAAVDAVDKQLAARGPGPGLSTETTLLIGATVAGLLALVPGVNAAVASALSAANVLLSYAKDQVPAASGQDSQVSGRDARAMFASFMSAVDETMSSTDSHWELLGERMAEVHGHLQKIREDNEGKVWIPPRPTMADGPVAPGDFHHEIHA